MLGTSGLLEKWSGRISVGTSLYVIKDYAGTMAQIKLKPLFILIIFNSQATIPPTIRSCVVCATDRVSK